MSTSVQLGGYNNGWYSPGRSMLWRSAWLFFGLPVFRCTLLPFSGLRVMMLRLFGAKVGSGVVIRSDVNVKYPWHLEIGNDCWIGEATWIDNLTTVRLGNDVCVSQGCYICTGNHDWADPVFGLIVRPVELEDAAWAGARCLLAPGVTLHEGAVASAGSIIVKSVPAWEIHGGNPASFLRRRSIRELRLVREKQEVAL